MRRVALKWACISLAACGLLVALAVVVRVGIESEHGPLTPKVILAYSTTCGTSSFCVAGPAPATGPTLYPGAQASTLPLKFTNYLGVPISVTQVIVRFTNSFQHNGGTCDSSAFQVSTSTGASGSPSSGPTETIAVSVTVPPSSGSTPGTATYNARLALANQGNQFACEGLALSMAYEASANYNYSSCVTTKTSGNLTVASGRDICITSTGSQGGNITVAAGGRLDLLGGTVGGNVTIQSGGGLNVQGGSITGNVTSTGANFYSFCGANVGGNVSAASSTSLVLIGDGSDDGTPACAGNTISGGVSLSSNTAGAELGGNAVSGTVTLVGTTGAGSGAENASPEIESNKVSGTLTCTGNTPAPTNDGHPNNVSGKRSGQCAAAGF